ncbi:MAG: hypothetical protein J6W00_14635 [Lentisphaeria bacterium]|nr:hypothetical protein [Lentisphaeria bacterium]
MSGTEIVNSVLKVAEKASRIDLEQAGKKACETVKSLNVGTIVNAINVNSAERIERRTMATLDVAYLLANIDGWFTEKQEACFEKIAASLGKKPSDVSAHAVGLNAKLAHIRERVTEDELLGAFIAECRSYCEAFDGMLIPSRRAFALWITLGLADGEMSSTYRKALDLLRKEFKHSALLFGAMGALPVYGAAAVVGGVGMGLLAAIAGGLKTLKHKQTLDKYVPLVSEEFMLQAERIIAEASTLEAEIAEMPDSEKQSKYENLIQQLEELINPPSDDDDDEDNEE